MCYSSKYDGITNYRVDRMEAANVESETISQEAQDLLQDRDLTEYTEQVFKLYGGPAEDVMLEFDYSLIGVVYDKFGENTPIIRSNQGNE